MHTFTKLAIPPKNNFRVSIQKRGGVIRPLKLRVIWKESVKLGRKGGVSNVGTKHALG
jgi:hypothetical protein